MQKTLIFSLLFFVSSYAKAYHFLDTVAVKTDTVQSSSLILQVSLNSRFIWRGIDFASSPSVQGLLGYHKKGFEVGAYGAVTTNGSKEGFGNTLELYTSYNYKAFTLTIDDYFFFNAEDIQNDYFNYNYKDTQHFLEARLKYQGSKMSMMAGYTIYSASADDTHGLYLEGEYFITDNISLFAGYITGQSFLNFYDAGGFCSLGVNASRPVQLSDNFSIIIKTSLIVNPNYKNVADVPSLSGNPMNMLFSIIF